MNEGFGAVTSAPWDVLPPFFPDAQLLNGVPIVVFAIAHVKITAAIRVMKAPLDVLYIRGPSPCVPTRTVSFAATV